MLYIRCSECIHLITLSCTLWPPSLIILHLISPCCCCCSVAKACLSLCNPMDWSTPGFPVLHYLLEFVQTGVHWVSDASNYVIPWRGRGWNFARVFWVFPFGMWDDNIQGDRRDRGWPLDLRALGLREDTDDETVTGKSQRGKESRLREHNSMHFFLFSAAAVPSASGLSQEIGSGSSGPGISSCSAWLLAGEQPSTQTSFFFLGESGSPL